MPDVEVPHQQKATNPAIWHQYKKEKCEGYEPFLVVIKDNKSKEVQQIFIGAWKRELFGVADPSVTTAITLFVSCYYGFNVAY